MLTTHRKIVGICHLVVGALSFLPTIVMTAMFGGIYAIMEIGSRHATDAADAADVAEAKAIFGIGLGVILLIVMITTALVGVLSLAAGAGVLLRRRWGDLMAMVLGVLALFNVPVGTAFGAYTLWVLMKADPLPQRALPQRDYAAA